MNDSHFLALAWTQLIQVSILIAVVWLLVKLFARQRPHLAHALWLVVLIKCVTPPVMSSPTGLMSHLTIPKPAWLTIKSPVKVEEEIPEPELLDLAPKLPPDPLPLQVSEGNFEVDDLSRGIVIDEDELPPEFFAGVEVEEEFLTADEPPPVVKPDVPEEPVAAAVPVSSRLWKIWFGSAGCVLLITFARVLFTLRRVDRNRVETPENLAEYVSRLSTKLRLRRKVRVLVTAARVGPAVVGFFRPLLILPQVVTQGRSAQELEPIIAHELLHVKRGDLGVGWLQVLVQSLWWFHPLVWLVNRFLSREAERCCDEAVVAELACPPARYARCLLDVLEQKRNLTPIPACPGVKPVELTKQRMERIMKLGQGCRKRTPWWCWLVVMLLGVVVLPGRGENEAEANQATLIFQLKEADAAQVTTEIEKESLDAEKGSPKIVTRTYSIEGVVQRMCEDHKLTEQAAQIHLEMLIGNSMTSFESAIGFRANPPLLTKCIVNENTLIVRGLEERHEMVAGLLKLWEQVGLYQIKVSTRYATTRLQVSTENVTGKQDANSALTTRLTEQEELQLINTLQSEPHTNLLFAPSVTLFNGQRAVVFDEVYRPFVTGMKDDEPVIEVLPDGWKFVVTPTVDAAGNIKLDYQIHLAEISDVETKELSGRDGKEPASVQVPKTRQVHLESIVKLRDGETLLVSGLNEQIKDGDDPENFLVMITPKLEKVDLENLSWESMAVNVSKLENGGGSVRSITTDLGAFSFTNEGKVLPTPMSGVGINSNSGVTGSIVLDERSFDAQPAPVPTPAQPARPWIKHTWAWLKHTPPWKKYDRDISVSFEQTPLKQAIEEICAAGDLKVMFLEDDKDGIAKIIELDGYPQVFCDENELAEEGFSLSVPVTFSSKNKAAIPILEEILRPFGLGLGHSRGGQAEYFLIQPKDFLDRTGWTVIYPVGDLLEQDPSLQSGPIQGVPILDKISHQDRLFKAKPRTKSEIAEVLIEVLEKTLAWDHSEANMATGTMRYRESSEALVICCDRDQHDLIAKLLSKRRKACGLEAKLVPSVDGAAYPAPPVIQNQARTFPNPVAADEIDTVQLQFLGPKHVPVRLSLMIAAFDQSGGLDFSMKPQEFRLPGRRDLAPGKRYLLRLRNGITHRPEFYWTLEIPEWNELTKRCLDHNAIPLAFTDEDLGQVSAHNSLTKVVYFEKRGSDSAPRIDVRTLSSTRLDPGVDPVEEAKKRGTILAVLRSHTGKFVSGSGVNSDSVVVGQVVHEEHPGDDQADPELWKILVQWERAGNDYEKVSSKFLRFVYDTASQVEKRSKGSLYYHLSGAWHLDIEPVKIEPAEKSQKLSRQGKPYSLKSDHYGFSICDGTRVAQAQQDNLQIRSLPEESRGRDIFSQPESSPFTPPVPFVIGLPAEKAVPRYQITLLPNTDEESVWLRILPKRLADRKNWNSAEVILDRTTFLPRAVKLIDATGAIETVYAFTDFKVNGDAEGKSLDLTKPMKEYKPFHRVASNEHNETTQPEKATHLSPIDGPGPSVMPHLKPIGVDTVQLRFQGPRQSQLTIFERDRLQTRLRLVLPGRKDLAPGRKYLMTLEYIPGRTIKSEWPVDSVHDPKFHWGLEIPEWNERTRVYLQHNSLPLEFTGEDLDQVSANNMVTKVLYLPDPSDAEKTALGSVETIVSTSLDPGRDPVEEAKKRGSIMAIVRSGVTTSNSRFYSDLRARQLEQQIMNDNQKIVKTSMALRENPAKWENPLATPVDGYQNLPLTDALKWIEDRVPEIEFEITPQAQPRVEAVRRAVPVGAGEFPSSPVRAVLSTLLSDTRGLAYDFDPTAKNEKSGKRIIRVIALEDAETPYTQTYSHQVREIRVHLRFIADRNAQPEFLEDVPHLKSLFTPQMKPLADSGEILVDLIRFTVEEKEWWATQGRIHYLPHTETLLVTAPKSVHTQVHNKLQQVREELKTQAEALSATEVKAKDWKDLVVAEEKPIPEPSPEQSERLVTLSYPVADLVVPVPGVGVVPVKQEAGWGIPVTGTPISIPGPARISAPDAAPGADTEEKSTSDKDASDPPSPYRTHAGILPDPIEDAPEAKQNSVAENLKSLSELIKKSVRAEEGWHPEGKASLMVSESTFSLVIRARQSTHDQIAEVLEDLRRKQDLQVTFECHIVALTEEESQVICERIGIDYDFENPASNRVMDETVSLLEPEHLKRFLRAVDKQEGADLLAAPKMTAFNGVGVEMKLSRAVADDREVENSHYMIIPSISEDRRTIDIKFAVNPTNRLDVLSKSKSMTVPDGETVFIEVTDELLSSPKTTGVPEIDKALRELKKKELGVRTFVLLTPRIIIQEEEEALLGIPAATPQENQPNQGQDQKKSNALIMVKPVMIIDEDEDEKVLEIPIKKD